MREEYDFKAAKRGVVLASPGKTRITIMLDNDVIEAFKAKAEATGRGYQTMMNDALREAMDPEAAPVSVRALRAMLDARFKLAA